MPRTASHIWKFGSALVVVALITTAAGCTGEPASPAATAAPSATSGAPSTPPVTPTNTPSPTPGPTRLPSPVSDTWVPAGPTVHSYGYSGSRLFALPEGGAILVGVIDEWEQPLDGMLAAERWDPAWGWRAGAVMNPSAATLRFTETGSRMLDPIGGPGGSFEVVALRDGRVLVAGGDDGSHHSIASAAIYDPASDTWGAVAPLLQARTHAAAALLPDGRILVVGGFAWDPDWDMGAAPGAQLARASVPAGGPGGTDDAQLLDIAVPPFGPALATAEVFDPVAGTWSGTGPMRYARTGPAIAVLADGRILVAGANGEPTHIDARAFTTAEVFDPSTGRFTSAGTLPAFDRTTIARRGVDLPDGAAEPGTPGALVALRDGGAMLVGREVSWKHEGEVVWSARLAPDLVTWRTIDEPYALREFHDASGDRTQTTGVSRLDALVIVLADDSVLVAGGNAGYSTNGPAPVDARRYDPAGDRWVLAPELPEPRDGPLGVRLSDGTVLLVGGWHETTDGSAWARDAWRYRPEALPPAE